MNYFMKCFQIYPGFGSTFITINKKFDQYLITDEILPINVVYYKLNEVLNQIRNFVYKVTMATLF